MYLLRALRSYCRSAIPNSLYVGVRERKRERERKRVEREKEGKGEERRRGSERKLNSKRAKIEKSQ